MVPYDACLLRHDEPDVASYVTHKGKRDRSALSGPFGETRLYYQTHVLIGDRL